MGGPVLTKNQRKRLNAKKKKQALKVVAADGGSAGTASESGNGGAKAASAAASPAPLAVTVEYVSAEAPSGDDPAFSEFASVFEKFLSAEDLTKSKAQAAEEDAAAAAVEEEAKRAEEAALHSNSDDDDDSDGGGGGGGGAGGRMSRRKRRLASRLTVAELKQLVARPEVVEAHDVTASDPRLLVHLKSYRNTVEVPRHWCQKRKYLQGKRGIEKPPFQLPDFVAQTGIAKVRGSEAEEPVDKKLKNLQRSRMAPKLGKIDIDYQVLHDAFFRYQTKPKSLTRHGQLYHEGKEFETTTHTHVPGVLGAELKAALGMPEGAPPPWLINMQRYGPPPSYPSLKVPGLSAPIPAGAAFGYHPGGWGKPPVDEFGRPLYGDVFGAGAMASEGEAAAAAADAAVDKLARWGALEPEPESEEEEEEAAAAAAGGEDEDMDEGEDDAFADISGMETPMGSEAGMGGTDSVASEFELRKGGTESVSSVVAGMGGAPPELYKVLEQKDARVGSTALMGSSHSYALPAKSGVDVAIDADELEGLDEEALRLKYQEGVEAKQAGREDISDLMADQDRKRKRLQDKKASKKHKDFKF